MELLRIDSLFYNTKAECNLISVCERLQVAVETTQEWKSLFFLGFNWTQEKDKIILFIADQ